MVMIINGEIVQDNDPRAIAKRGAPPATQRTQNSGPRIAGINSTPQPQRGQQPQQPGGGDGEGVDGMLTPLSRIIGIEGRRITIPPIPQINFSGYAFPLVHAAVAAMVALLSGDAKYALACLVALAILNPK
ncbi:hypothetical protein BASA81_001900 [Batrachochytrium salamandrivorans]|nr:hypothetical protein BASA81_001900 [Batrachochytrium salamandrivorans]